MKTQRKPIGLLKSAVLAFFWTFGVPALLMQSQAAEQPQPGPEHKKLEVWVGEWTFETQSQPSPLASASGSLKAKFTCKMILGGFFLERRGKGTSEGTNVEWFDLTGYDPIKKSYVSYGFINDGVADFMSLAISGNTWNFSGGDPIKVEGKVRIAKMVNTISPDGNTVSEVVQHSDDDGKTWHTIRTSTFKKVSK